MNSKPPARPARVRALTGFGAKTEEKILAGIAQSRAYADQFVYPEAWALAEELRDALRGHPAVGQIGVAGSVRRGVELVKNIDLVASSREPAALLDDFVTWTDVEKIVERTPDTATIRLTAGISATLRVVTESEYAFALHHFTGSPEHNAAAARTRHRRGQNADGTRPLYNRARREKEARRASPSPAAPSTNSSPRSVCRTSRPNCAKAAARSRRRRSKEIPRLIEWTQLRGTFHCHTNCERRQEHARRNGRPRPAISA